MTSSMFSGPPATGVAPSNAELAALREEFPAFRIWREITGDRVRFVARSRRPGLNPHTVVTPDLGELRNALTPAWPDEGSRIAVPPAGPALARPTQGPGPDRPG